MHSIKLNTKQPTILDFPQGIWEMSREQYIYFCKLVAIWQKGILSYQTLKIYVVYEFLNLKRSKDQSDQIVENVLELTKLVDAYFILENKNGAEHRRVALNYVYNLIPTIEIGEVLLQGPKAALQDCTYGEVGAANALFIDFSKTGSPEILNKLVATLYRPSITKRPLYDSQEMDHLSLIENISEEIKFGIFLWFASCQRWIANNEALDIGGGVTVNVSSLFKSTGNTTKKGFGFVGVIFDLAQTGVFGNSKEVANQNYYDVLIRLVQLQEEAKSMKRNAKRN